jgi:hypothetical protein
LRHGGQLLGDAQAREVSQGRAALEPVLDVTERGSSGFWNWFRQAF